MAHEPKLEIYKLRLRNKVEGGHVNLRELLRKKFNGYPVKEYPNLERPITQAGILTTMFTDLINKIDLKGFNKNENKKKGFTVASKKNGSDRQAEIASNSNTSVLYGILEGGKYGRKRALREIDNKNRGSSIETKHLIGDKFYFLLYTPIDESTIILMIQGYTEIKISDVFVKFLKEYFTYQKTYVCEVEYFIPQNLKDKYIEEATFKSMTFSSDWNVKANFENDFNEKEYNLEVKIIITDKSIKKAKHKSYIHYLQELVKSTFKLADLNERKLEDFKNKKAKMESKGKEFPINFDDENEIRPTILLSNEGIRIEDGLIPNFQDIDKYCKKLLNDVINELNPQNAVGRL